MELTRRSLLVYFLLGAIWVLVLAWQTEEHLRVRQAAKADLSLRSKDIANTVSACIRGMQFRRIVPQDRLESVLNELAYGRSNELVVASEVLSIVLINAAGVPVASAGRPVDFAQRDILQQGEHWGNHSVTFVNPVDLGASVLPPMTNGFGDGFRGRPPPRREPGAESTNGPEPGPRPPPHELVAADPGVPADTNSVATSPTNPPPRGEGRPREGSSRWRRPPWLRDMSEQEFQALLEQRALHGLVLTMSIDSLQAASAKDLWLRSIIALLATLSAVGSALAWRNLAKSSDLQLRLVRASEMNTHLKEMNLAAAGLAHETRNPLNIIRGLAQMIARQPEAPPEVRQKSTDIINEADKVAAQLNEFINYSRPRELRRTAVSLGRVLTEVGRTLGYDLEEKKVSFEVQGEPLNIEADEQLLRQTLFNLLLNAIQAVDNGGAIRVKVQRRSPTEGLLEVCDNGPGVPAERRTEIFKPYFTTQKQGTGLGLAVVQQIVLAHGWEIECVQNEPKGACFRLTHLRIAIAPSPGPRA